MLQGSLDNFALDEVLSLLSTTHKTGRLAISGDRGTGSLWLDTGEVVGADASNLVDRAPSGEVMFELLRFESGSFLFTMDDRLDEPGVAESIDQLLGAAKERISEWRIIEAVVPSLDHALWLTPALEANEVLLSRRDWQAVVAVGEGNSVGNVCDLLESNEIDGSREIKGLVERGVLAIGELQNAESGTGRFQEPSDSVSDFSAVAATFVEPADTAEFGDFAESIEIEAAADIDDSVSSLNQPNTEFEFIDQEAVASLDDAVSADEFLFEAEHSDIAEGSEAAEPTVEDAVSFGDNLADSDFGFAAPDTEAVGTEGFDADAFDAPESYEISEGAASAEALVDTDAAAFDAPEAIVAPVAAEYSAPSFGAAAAFGTPAAAPTDGFAPPTHAGGRPPMPPPPSFSGDGAIQTPPPPPPTAADAVDGDGEDEGDLLMRFLNSDSH